MQSGWSLAPGRDGALRQSRSSQRGTGGVYRPCGHAAGADPASWYGSFGPAGRTNGTMREILMGKLTNKIGKSRLRSCVCPFREPARAVEMWSVLLTAWGSFPSARVTASLDTRRITPGHEHRPRTGGPQRYVGLDHLAAVPVDPGSTILALPALPTLVATRIRLFLSACHHARDRV